MLENEMTGAVVVLTTLALFQTAVEDQTAVEEEKPQLRLTVQDRIDFTDAKKSDGDTVGWVLEIYDIRDLTEGEFPFAMHSAADVAQLVRDNLTLMDNQVKVTADCLVIRANPEDHRTLKHFFTDLRQFVAPCDVTSMVGTLVRDRRSEGDDLGSDIGGVRILTLSGTEVSKIEASRHAPDGRIDLTTHVGESSWDLNFVNATATAHGPVKEGEVIHTGNAKDKSFLVGFDLIQDVEGHPQGVLVPRLETLSEGLTLEATYRLIGTGPDAGRLKVSVDATQSKVRRPVPTRNTATGRVHIPESETAKISATLLLESGGGFLVVFEAAEEGGLEEAVLVSIARND